MADSRFWLAITVGVCASPRYSMNSNGYGGNELIIAKYTLKGVEIKHASIIKDPSPEITGSPLNFCFILVIEH